MFAFAAWEAVPPDSDTTRITQFVNSSFSTSTVCFFVVIDKQQNKQTTNKILFFRLIENVFIY